MTLFNPKKDDKLITMLKNSKQSFRFDQNQVRVSLLNRIAAVPIIETKKFFNYKLATAFAAIILFVGMGATFAVADSANPGDKLFAIDTFQEKMVLNLPLPQQTRAKIQAKIVAERVLELNKIQRVKDQDEVKVEAVKNSRETLTNTFDSIKNNRNQLQKRGKAKAAARLDAVLGELDELANEQEYRTDEIKKDVRNVKLREELDESVRKLRELRRKSNDSEPKTPTRKKLDEARDLPETPDLGL